jgi:hypothetical protein
VIFLDFPREFPYCGNVLAAPEGGSVRLKGGRAASRSARANPRPPAGESAMADIVAKQDQQHHRGKADKEDFGEPHQPAGPLTATVGWNSTSSRRMPSRSF